MRFLGGAVAVLLLVGLTATPSYGAATRAEYVAQVDAICQTSIQQVSAARQRGNRLVKKQNRRIAKQDKRLENTGRFSAAKKIRARAGKQLGRAFHLTLGVPASIWDGFTNQIAAVAPALSDEATVAGWLASRRTYVQLIYGVIRTARHGKVFEVLPKILDAAHVRHQGEQLIAGFGFTYCGTNADR
jgi:hypothetical protein